MPLWDAIAESIADALGAPFAITGREASSGGCVNQAFVLTGRDGTRWFVKLNRAERLAMFEAEYAGLVELRSAAAMRVPTPLCRGSAAGESWLVLEYLPLSGRGDAAVLGRRLAALHGHRAERFGWGIDNTIGDTSQANTPNEDWVSFWRERRLLPQLALAAGNGIGRSVVERGERLAAELDGFFSGYRPIPSLLHGDLWGGNAAYVEGEPVLFDPAVYYGDREADLAMTELFGGFGPAFHAAYRETWPLDPGYADRRDLYNLYHVLNHYNLFGGGYALQAARMIDGLLARLR